MNQNNTEENNLSKDSKLNKYKEFLEWLEEIKNPEHQCFDVIRNEIKTWKEKLLPLLPLKYKNIISNLTIVSQDDEIPFEYTQNDCSFIQEDYDIAKAILKDCMTRYYLSNTKKDLQLLKLLDAREKSPAFEEDLAKMICGDNNKFLYRSSYFITNFFQDLGYSISHDGSTRRIWIAEQLTKFDIYDIDRIIREGLFRKKDFKKIAENEGYTNSYKGADLLINEAKQEFKLFLDECFEYNQIVDLDDVFDLNINNELLFNKPADTEDKTLNILINDAKNFFITGDKQTAIEKLWDAFERIKTLLPGDKKTSSTNLVNILSAEIKDDFFNEEFMKLTKLGNNYEIRHFETNKKPIKDTLTKEYLFFRVLALIDLCLVKINDNKNTEDDLYS